MRQYDHQTKAGNAGDVIKHPALIAALKGLLAEHQGPFRYGDAFAGRPAYELREDGAWPSGIAQLAARWAGGNRDVGLWRRQWTAASGALYPGSTRLAQRVLAGRGNDEIRAFEIVDACADELRGELGEEAVFTRSATPADWVDWRPDLLFIDPPGLRSERRPDDPTLESLLRLAAPGAEHVRNVLLWLPMVGEGRSSGIARPLDAGASRTRDVCVQSGFGVLAVRWHEDGPMPGCLLVFRFQSPKVLRRVTAAVETIVRTMDPDWRMV